MPEIIEATVIGNINDPNWKAIEKEWNEKNNTKTNNIKTNVNKDKR